MVAADWQFSGNFHTSGITHWGGMHLAARNQLFLHTNMGVSRSFPSHWVNFTRYNNGGELPFTSQNPPISSVARFRPPTLGANFRTSAKKWSEKVWEQRSRLTSILLIDVFSLRSLSLLNMDLSALSIE